MSFWRIFLGLGVCGALVACSAGSTSGGSDFGPGTGGDAGSGPAGDAGSGGSGAGAAGAGGGSGGSGGGTSIHGDPTMDPTCGGKDYPATVVPANVLIVLDRSGSMNDMDKWPSATGAISDAIDGASDLLRMGMLRFPEGNFDPGGMEAACLLQNPPSAQCKALEADGGCKDISMDPNVPVGPLSTTRTQIKDFMSATSPDGNTPTRWALRYAWKSMEKLQDQGDRYVLLITDGEPTTHTPPMNLGPLQLPESNIECGTEQDIYADAVTARTQLHPPVKTFVVGVPGTESSQDVLSSIANSGGTCRPGGSPGSNTCHYQIGSGSFKSDLTKVLVEISGKVISCTYAVPTGQGDVDPDLVNVVLTGQDGTKNQIFKDTAHQDGWDYTDGSHSAVTVYGPQCEAIQGAKVASVSVALGCKTVVR